MTDLFKVMKKDSHHYVLATLLIIFIVSDVRIPSVIGELVDNVLGKIVVVMSAVERVMSEITMGVHIRIYIFLNCNNINLAIDKLKILITHQK